jgi:hypothetical protein
MQRLDICCRTGPTVPPLSKRATGQNIGCLRPSPRGQQQRARRDKTFIPFPASRLGARHATPERPTQALPISPIGARCNRPDFPLPFFPSHFVALCTKLARAGAPNTDSVRTRKIFGKIRQRKAPEIRKEIRGLLGAGVGFEPTTFRL